MKVKQKDGSVKIAFICGCLHTVEDPGFHHDDDGMLTCPIHGDRRYGWLSTGGRDHTLDSMSPLEYERWYVFGERVTVRVNVHAPISPDIRMNQIPENVYATVLKSRSGQDPHEREAAVKDREITQADKDRARYMLDLQDRTGWPVVDTQSQPLWDGD